MKDRSLNARLKHLSLSLNSGESGPRPCKGDNPRIDFNKTCMLKFWT